MPDAIVVLNAGSSSVKFSLFVVRGAALELDVRGQVEGLGNTPRFTARGAAGSAVAEHRWSAPVSHGDALEHLFGFLDRELADDIVRGVGHRVVHGGLEYSHPVELDAAILARLDTLVPLAPLHQPHNLAPIRTLMAERPHLRQIACFDTAFHRTVPELAQMFALPYALHQQGVRRYGFHGLSYEYIASALPALDEGAALGRTIVLHLGNGCSMCALDGGRSVATTMGFTAVDGLMMGTRTGQLDAGVVLYLMDQRGMDARAIERLIYQESGLFGVSGLSGDMRTLLASEEPRAQLAIDLFCYRIRRELGSLVAALGGVDAIVFTAGIGEHAAPIRARVLQDAGWLGVEIDAGANERHEARISAPQSRVSAWVIPTNEEKMIAQHTLRCVRG